MRCISRRFVWMSLAALGLSPVGYVLAQDRSAAKPNAKKNEGGELQRVEGVILQAKPFSIHAADSAEVDDADPEKGRPALRYRLTINTEIPWSDYVRDEAVNPAKAKKEGKKDPAPKTKESVAIEGQPEAPPNETFVDISPATKIELRYRSSTDESDDGAPTVEAAEALQRDPSEKAKGDEKTKRIAAKPVAVAPKDLRVGQYVIVEYQRGTAENPATKIIVLRPVGGADTSAQAEETKPEVPKKP